MRRPKDPAAWQASHPTGKRTSVRPGASKVVSFDEFAARAPKKQKGLRSAGGSEIERTLRETTTMREANDWTVSRPRHFVALYFQLHRHVYGIEPGELRGKAWTAACLMAARTFTNDFTGDTARFVAFIVWAWKREKKAHAKGIEDRRRMGWRLQFSSTLVTDYRLYLAQRTQRHTG